MVNERVTELTMTFTLNLSHPHRDLCSRRHSGLAHSMQQGRRREGTVSAGWEGAAAGEACPQRPSLPTAAASVGAWGQEPLCAGW